MSFEIENGELRKYTEEPGVSEVVVPDGVTFIDIGAFAGCSKLESVIIPDGVTAIGCEAFKNCFGLKNIIIPDSVKYVDNRAFERDSVPETIIAKPDMLTDSRWKTVAVMTFLGIPEKFSPDQAEACKKYLCLQKRWLLPKILCSDIVHAMYVFAEKGEITKSNVESDFLNPAVKAGATQCVAFLMDWESKNVTPEDKEKLLEEEYNKDPFNAADMKKIWSSKKLADGTLSLTSYKNTDTDIMIPERIGKNRVTCLDNRLFSVEKPGRLFAQREVLENITSVTIPSGVTKIGMSVFRGCSKLQVVVMPETIKSIGRYAFLDCSKSLTIHAPSGSFAAEYARKNKIKLEIDQK